MILRTLMSAVVGGVILLGGGARGQEETLLKVENFSRDPRWEDRNNQGWPKEMERFTQDFGYSATRFAGEGEGELGGLVQSTATPATYAEEISVKTLEERVSATGTFAVTQSTAGAGVFFGYFNGRQPGSSVWPIGAFGLCLSLEEDGVRLDVRLGNASNQTCGATITPAGAIKADGTRYRWKLDYDPGAAQGHGRFKFVVTSDSKTADASEGDTFVVDLPAGFRKHGATFDRFGLMNRMQAGGNATLYFDDLSYSGKSEDFTIDPGWTGEANRGTFEESEAPGVQSFGYRETNHAGGGGAGEMGGRFWRTDKGGAYCADRIGTVTLAQRLEAGGKLQMPTAGPEAEMYLGWFSSGDAHAEQPSAHGRNFLGVHVAGRARTGHCLEPMYRTAGGTEGRLGKGPVITPGKSCEWMLVHDPAANRGEGELRLTLGGEMVILPMKSGHLKEGAVFDRFGLISTVPGGDMLKIYFDDLKYSVGQ